MIITRESPQFTTLMWDSQNRVIRLNNDTIYVISDDSGTYRQVILDAELVIMAHQGTKTISTTRDCLGFVCELIGEDIEDHLPMKP